jgi:hypothetical protein
MVMAGVPAGAYRLQLLPGAASWDSQDNRYLPESVEVVVEEAKETRVEVTARIGGSLAIVLNAADPSNEREAKATSVRTLSGRAGNDLSSRIAQAQVSLQGLGVNDRELQVDFLTERGGLLRGGLSLGQEAISTKQFAPGTYRLRIALEGCETVEQLVTISSGETTRVQVELRASH